ncbi:methyl-accepting chemotaxis protein [Desulfohalobiaceae bacterium Ax17]|uniref:methyl-accepting chemotaxis protein n=1 Tax=Desulfovulcanus ferrireducens TaxID=2831190 RepID=UPI00207BB358|nr:methyl-accepting chemotaxis protein [Desulfovulcanus ferrireducens]MBT8763879.1 methyl-accepting chemotaxis protein [Desulfovulcanus ferrireducens]
MNEINSTKRVQDFIFRCKILPKLGQGLASSIQDREKDFLMLGENLQRINSEILAFKEQTEVLVGVAGGEKIEDIVKGLEQGLDRLRKGYVQTSYDRVISGMAKELGQVKELGSYVLNFKKIVRRLQTLGVFTRIESARLGQVGIGFATLADDVEGLAQKIVIYGQEILQTAQSLGKKVDLAQVQTVGLKNRQDKLLRNVFVNLNENLEVLKNLQQSCAQIAMEVEQGAKEIANKISTVVASMQFHDITRQQLEHIQEVLFEVHSLLQDVGQGDEEHKMLEVVAWFKEVGELQLRQLRYARDKFYQAVVTLLDNLTGIETEISKLHKSLARTHGFEEEGAASLLEGISLGIKNVAKDMRIAVQENEQISGMMNSVIESVSQMNEFVEYIEEVGLEIELIALNASIKAAHTGDKGRALGVLAVATQKLSMEAREKTDNISKLLQEIVKNSQLLAKDVDEAFDHGQTDELIDYLSHHISELIGLNKQVQEKFSQSSQASEAVLNEIKRVVKEIDVHEKVVAELEGVEQELRLLVQEAGAIVPAAYSAESSEKLKGLLSKYTMQSERLIHMDMQGEEEQYTVDEDENVELFDDDFDENVELF